MDRAAQGTSPEEAAGTRATYDSAGLRKEAPVDRSQAGAAPRERIYPRGAARSEAEFRLVQRVFSRCNEYIQEACRASSVPAGFLGALTANESGGNSAAVRFEPSVYRHLKAVAEGESPRYGGIDAEALCEELAEVLHPKTGEFHAMFLNSLFRGEQASELSRLADEALRELASSWGFVQIMGFHVVGWRRSVRDLVEPRTHYHFANQLLAEFAVSHKLNLARDFEGMFRCWNTGRPDGKTADAAYVENGLGRMEMYRMLIAGGSR